jgi:SHS family lactate transporter-like MFS transporter
MAPDAVRGLWPGLAYQCGILFAAPTNTLQHFLRDKVGYSWALAGFELVTIFVLMVVLSRGTERHGRAFHSRE